MHTALKLLLLTTSFSVFAQTRYTVKGFFAEPGKTNPVPYSINWVESGAEIKGLYKDNTIKESIPAAIVQSERMRLISIKERGLMLMTNLPSENSKTKTLPVSLTMMDQNKNILAAHKIEADFSVELPQAQEERQEQQEAPCRSGFGGLAGFCGSYQGMVVEEVDTANRCTLVTEGTVPRLELDTNGQLAIRVAPVSTVMPNPLHVVGRIPVNVDKSSVDLMSRVCRPLDGTTFGGDNCKRINVTGDFSTTESNKAHFFGTYIIVDEKTNERCQYRFSLDRG